MKDRLNALDVALNNELKEREFYLRHATRTKNPVGAAMFRQIAAEELDHYERLTALREAWEAKKQWPETVPLKVNRTVVKDVLKEALRRAVGAPAGDADDREALKTAIAFEARGTEFYAGLRDQVADPREKAFFDLLASIEHEHYVSLKDTEEYLNDPAGWFRKTDRGGLDGA